MERQLAIAAALTAALMAHPTAVAAQAGHHQGVYEARDYQLHVSTRWEECAFQLDPGLTQQAWRQFAREAGLVTYFRPLKDARPLGAGRFEISIVQAQTGIDDGDAAWNDTFVHPDSTHWLFEGSGLAVPGLMARAGVTDRLDVGAYFTKNPKSNYGFAGVQAQYNVLRQLAVGLDASVRGSMVTLFGPDDLDYTVYGVDVVASRQWRVLADWIAVSPYAGASAYLGSAHEKSATVALADERVFGVQGTLGAEVKLAAARIGVEYNLSRVDSRSIRIGFAF